jgi:GT2 family glycosyltransferase
LARDTTVADCGGLDERFFMYCEDMDWGKTAHLAGWQVVYHPGAVVTHLMGRSTDRRPLAMTRAHHRSMLQYVDKHHGRWAALLAAPLIGLRLLAVLAPVQGWRKGD